MKFRTCLYILLLLCFSINAGALASPQDQVPVETIHFAQQTNEDGGSQQPAVSADLPEDAPIVRVNDSADISSNSSAEVATMQSSASSGPAWWSIGFYILLTIVVGSFLIYLYIEYGRKVVAVRQEMDELREENEKLKAELSQKIGEIEKIAERLRKAEAELDEKSQKAGMADVAAGVLHNVANVLSSVNSSNTFIQDTAKYSKVDGLIKANKLLREHIDHIDQFIFEDPRGKKLLNYYLKLEEPLRKEREEIVSQSVRLDEKISIISDVITAQQSHAVSSHITSETVLSEIVESTLSLQEDMVDEYKFDVSTDLKATTPVIAQRSKLIHVLVNFIKNAGESMEENHPGNKKLMIKTWEDSYKVYLSVTDNGMGIKGENIDKIFSHTYTTKKKGHGFGLHSSANYMKEMGGKIEVSSEGRGKGTTFTLVFPIIREHEISRK